MRTHHRAVHALHFVGEFDRFSRSGHWIRGYWANWYGGNVKLAIVEK